MISVYCILCVCLVSGPAWYISYSYGTIQPVCAESVVKHQLAN